MLERINALIWGVPMIFLLLFASALYLIPMLRAALGRRDHGRSETRKKTFQAVCTMLAATLGTGNIIGVALAISVGGPGAVFWLALSGLLCAGLKYAEGSWAIRLAEKDKAGPLRYIAEAFRGRFWSGFYAVACVLGGTLGIGALVQSRSMSDALLGMAGSWANEPWFLPVVMVFLLILCVPSILGGVNKLAKACTVLVPVMTVFYLGACVIVIAHHADQLSGVIAQIFNDAFTGTAAFGGFLGVSTRQAMRVGISRAIFSNESGMGTAGIAAGTTGSRDSQGQGMTMALAGVFDILACLVTGLVILCTQVWLYPANGAQMTRDAFAGTLGAMADVIVWVSLLLFAFSSVLGWSWYVMVIAKQQWGERAVRFVSYACITGVAIGPWVSQQLAWQLGDMLNACMIIPNVLALIILKIREKKISIINKIR